ncbi:hypothetical protein B9Z55_007484 [Caenorhabditis nigoni]|nr:hypothetical protein B9Z55_007484 [Caenorhabditis nigoni]
MCPPCADTHVKLDQCDITSVRHLIKNPLPAHCHECGNETDDPRICEGLSHIRRKSLKFDTFSVCADCIIEHHDGHETMKAVDLYSLRWCTVDIISKLLWNKLGGTTDQKCKLRKMRLDHIGQRAIYWASLDYPLYTEKNAPEPKLIGQPIIKENLIESIIDVLEDQYNQLEELKETCGCGEVYKEVERLKLFDERGFPTHFEAMCMEPDSNVKIDRCPFDLESSREWRKELLELIERNEVATEPLEAIWFEKDILFESDTCEIMRGSSMTGDG